MFTTCWQILLVCRIYIKMVWYFPTHDLTFPVQHTTWWYTQNFKTDQAQNLLILSCTQIHVPAYTQFIVTLSIYDALFSTSALKHERCAFYNVQIEDFIFQHHLRSKICLHSWNKKQQKRFMLYTAFLRHIRLTLYMCSFHSVCGHAKGCHKKDYLNVFEYLRDKGK